MTLLRRSLPRTPTSVLISVVLVAAVLTAVAASRVGRAEGTTGGSPTPDLALLVAAATAAAQDPPAPLALLSPVLPGPHLAPALAVPQPAFEVLAEGYLAEADLPPQVGRLIMFDRAAEGYAAAAVCSATLVAPSLVLTAAHCVVGFDGWAFYAGQYGDHAPGQWIGTVAVHPSGYDTLVDSAPQLDYALVRLEPDEQGRAPGDVVGVLPVELDVADLALVRTSMGYPSEGIFAQGCNGERCRPWFCRSEQAALFTWDTGRRQMGWGCTSNGGMSGGPALAQGAAGFAVVSVNSTVGLVVEDGAGGRAYGINLWGPELRTADYAELVARAEVATT